MINEKYIIKKKLGEGRSRVFLCEDVDFPGKYFAIKILPASASFEEQETFRNEYFILRRLNHPNIIKAASIGTIVRNDSPDADISPGSKFITLEYFEGGDLLNYKIQDENSLKKIITQLGSVLYYLHQSNFIYYDLKPENILFSDGEGNSTIKLIDLGLARYVNDEHEFTTRGSAEYIAPELLNNENHDHRVDLYSLGMLLYRLIYKQFPFKTENQLEIYKAHIEGVFDYPSSDISDKIVDIVKKLLSRDKEKRYYTSLQLLDDFNIPFEEIKKDWIPAKTFTNRKDALSVIHSFVNKQTDGEVLTIRGTEGSGKTSLLDEVFSRYDKTVLIRSSKSGGTISFWKMLLREIVFSDFIYPNLEDELLKDIFKLLQEDPADLLDSLKTIFIKIAKENKFILLLDEYNRYDELSLEVMKQLIPVMQINNIRLILSEDSSHPYISEKINNLSVVNLSPFTETQLIEHIERSFANFFPKEETRRVIMMYADLLPGSIDAFLKDIVLLNILDFTPAGPVIEGKEEKLKLLKSSQDEIYRLRLQQLSEEENTACGFLSLFEINLSDEIISELLVQEPEQTSRLIGSLREKNILSASNVSINPEFTSEGLKKYIYTNLPERDKLHLKAAEVIQKNFPLFSRVELARQFELSGLYYRSYEILKAELEACEKLSALSYKKKILEHLLDFPLVERDLNDIKYDLTVTLFRMGDKKSALSIIDELRSFNFSKDIMLELRVLKGNCLISTGEAAAGLDILKEALSSVKHDLRKQEILFDIASAEFDLNNYSQAAETCKSIIRNVSSSPETKGKSHNLLGLIKIYENGNIDGAIDHFEDALEVYEKAGLLLNVAGMEVNLGNLFNMKGIYEKAELHWNKAMQINLSIGNLEQEAKLLLNYGIYYFEKLDYETAIERYKRAHHILSSLGDKNGEGLVLINLGEVNLASCDFQNSFEALKKARKIFRELKNYEEETEALFMLGKFYFILGDNDGLDEVLKHYKDLLDQNLLVEKHLTNYSLLEQLKVFAEGRLTEFPEKLISIRNYYSENDDRINYTFTVFILCELFISLEKYPEAFSELNNEKFTEICESNKLLSAERRYYLGRISEKDVVLGLDSPANYYQKAYTLIEDESITELTWKILYAFTIFYLSRGNSSKAGEYMIYGLSILEYISENIKDAGLRNTYLSKPERKIALENLIDAEVDG